MEQLPHDPLRHGLYRITLSGLQRRQAGGDASKLRRQHSRSSLLQRPDQRGHPGGSAPGREPVLFLRDDGPRAVEVRRGSVGAFGQRPAEVVDVGHADARQRGDGRIDVPRDPQVEEEPRSGIAGGRVGGDRRPDHAPGDQVAERARRGDDQIGAGDGVGQRVESGRVRARSRGERSSPLDASVQHLEPPHTHPPEMGNGQRCHPAGPDHHGRAPLQPAQERGRQFRARLHESRRRRPDGGLRAHAAAGANGAAKEGGQHGPRSALVMRPSEGRPHLGQDLRLAEYHRIEPGRHREEVLRGIVLVVRVQRLGELVGIGFARLREEPLQVEEARVIRRDLGVDLDAIAGGEDDGLADGVGG